MNQPLNLSPNRPYLTRAIYQWLVDNELTPYILVDATQKEVLVPQQYVQDGQIILNIAPHSTHLLDISNECIRFSARFSGVSQDINVPMQALLGIYARENGVGLFFDPNEYNQSHQAEQKEPDEPPVEPQKKSRFKLVD